jgi:hypothetical protein
LYILASAVGSKLEWDNVMGLKVLPYLMQLYLGDEAYLAETLAELFDKPEMRLASFGVRLSWLYAWWVDPMPAYPFFAASPILISLFIIEPINKFIAPTIRRTLVYYTIGQ